MPADKAQLDTIEAYLRTVVPAEKVKELIEKFREADESIAQEAIVMFEQRSNLRLADVERLLKKRGL